MPIGVSWYSAYKRWRDGECPADKLIHLSAEAGAAGVELLDAFYYAPGTVRDRLPTLDEKEAVDIPVLDALWKTGLECGVFSVTNNFVFEDPTRRELELQKILWGIDQSRRFGAKVVRVFAGNPAENVSEAQCHEWIIKGLVMAARVAADNDVTLALENHGQLTGKSWQIEAILQEVHQKSGTNALAANTDFGNFLLVDEDPVEAVQTLADYAVMGHLKDFKTVAPDSDPQFRSGSGRGLNAVALGEGEVPIPACASLLRSGIWLNLEFEGTGDPFVEIPKSIAYARAVLAS